MNNGVHTILYSDDAEVTRTFLRDVLGKRSRIPHQRSRPHVENRWSAPSQR